MLSQITGALLMILETSSIDSTGISFETTFGPRNNLLKELIYETFYMVLKIYYSRAEEKVGWLRAFVTLTENMG